MKRALVLYDEKSSQELVKKAFEISKKCGYEGKCLLVNNVIQNIIQESHLILYCLQGRFLSGLELCLSEYVKNGGTLICLGGNPFSELEDGTSMPKGIRAFDIADTFLEAPIDEETCSIKGIGLYDVGETQELPMLDKVYAGLYHLSRRDEKTQGDTQRYAELIPVAGLYDKNGDMVAAPIVKVAYRTGGSLYLFTWTQKDENVLSSHLAQALAFKIMEKCFAGEVRFSLEMPYARYFPGEQPEILLSDIARNSAPDVYFKVAIYQKGKDKAIDVIQIRDKKQRIKEILSITEEGQYEIMVTAYVKDVAVTEKKTGFYLISEDAILQEMEKFSRIRVDPKVSTDFAVRDRKSVPIHGTTYFVTDEYQRCFLHFNLAKCEEDLSILQRDGFQVLRSGNWMLNVDFLGKDGSICETSRRALQAYFYCALQHGFHIQFTLGNVTLNDWDRRKCAVHNPQNTKKVHCLIKSFTALFGRYTNVMLDVLNEPSYSRQGCWTPVRPSGDSYERKAWIHWLKEKYKTIEKLRAAWGENALMLPDFRTVDVPAPHCFEGSLFRTEEDREYSMVADFWQFAQESYDSWLGGIRSLVRELAPDMVVVMGRDESLRVPEEQDCVLKGNLDMVCWHQWHHDAEIYTEYLLNRVKGHITCAQELGIYRVEEMRGGKRMSDATIAKKLERKLMFGFGNWIQWQSFHNPDKLELSENMLGIYRSDRSMTPAVPMMRQLMQAEKEIMPYLYGRKEDAFPILTLYSTSSHYSIYQSQSVEALRNHIYVLNRSMRQQSDVIPEHLFDETYGDAIGNPKLIIVPGAMRLSQGCFEKLLKAVFEGCTVLISGNIEENEYFAKVPRMEGLGEDSRFERINVRNYEQLQIGEQRFLLDFRKSCHYGDTENFLSACVDEHLLCDDVFHVKQYNIGKGTLIYCPLPVELAQNREVALKLYEMAMEKAKITSDIYSVEEDKESFFIHAIVYEGCTEYTIINEGASNYIRLIDRRGNTAFKMVLPAGRSCKLWVGQDGKMLGKYAIDGVIVEKEEI